MNHPPALINLAREEDFALGRAEVRPSLRQFTVNGAGGTVEPRVMQVLVSLARRAGEVVGRDELVARCWDGRIVGEDAIQRAIAKVRKLGETSETFTVETIPKVGYRLIAQHQAADTSPAAAPLPSCSNLPRRIEGLIGRDEDLAQVAAILRGADLVTITGPGGVGKTRLAHEVGRRAIDRHEDGVWLVELAPIGDPALVPGAIARVLGIQLSDPSDPAGELLDRLKYWHALLVLDNCEHLIDAVAALAEPILRHAPRVTLLVSSQEPLGVEGEHVFRLRSLGEADAVQLFAARARAADAGFAATPRNADAIRAICSRLDGIPLAIEMAAARAPTLGCDTLLALLDDRFRVLTGGRRTALPRQRTLHAALDWSHSLLSETEAAVFRRLSVFVGGFRLEAGCDVASDERLTGPTVLDALMSLTAKSLVAIENDGGRPRYRLLETTRAYAQEKLAEAGETRAVQRRRAAHFAAFLEPSPRDYFSSMSEAALLARYGLEIDNVTRALEWASGSEGDRELFIALAASSATTFARCSRFPEYTRWADLAVRSLDAGTPTSGRHRLLAMQAFMHALTYRGSALDLVERNLRTVWDTEDKLNAVFPVLAGKAFCLLEMGRIEDVETIIEHMSGIAGDAPSRMRNLTDYLACLAMWDRLGAAAARSHFDAALARMRSIGHDLLARLAIIEGSTSVAPQDDADTAIGGLRTLLAGISPSDQGGGYQISLCAARLMMLLGLRGGADDIAEARRVARIVERTRSRFVDFRYALALGCVAFGAGRHKDAARIAGFADLLRSRLSANFWFANIFADVRTALLRVMPEAEMARLWSEGAAITLDEALKLAIGEGQVI